MWKRWLRDVSGGVLNICMGGDSTTSLGKVFQCFTYVTVKKKKVFCIQMEFYVLNLCLLPLLLSVGTTENTLSSLLHSIRYLHTLARSPWSLLFSWTVLAVSAFSYMTDASVPLSSFRPFTGAQHIAPVFPCLSCTGSPKLDTGLQVWLISAE